MKKQSKMESEIVSLSILKRYMSELEASLQEASRIKANKEDDYDFLMSLAKPVGILLGLSQEASLLIGDLQKISQFDASGGEALETLKTALLKSFKKTDKPNGGSGQDSGSGSGSGSLN